MLNFVFVLIFLALILSGFRFFKGPSSSDRVVALDTLTTIISVLLVTSSLFFDNYILLDISFVFAALSFTSVIVISRYLEGGNS